MRAVLRVEFRGLQRNFVKGLLNASKDEIGDRKKNDQEDGDALGKVMVYERVSKAKKKKIYTNDGGLENGKTRRKNDEEKRRLQRVVQRKIHVKIGKRFNESKQQKSRNLELESSEISTIENRHRYPPDQQKGKQARKDLIKRNKSPVFGRQLSIGTVPIDISSDRYGPIGNVRTIENRYPVHTRIYDIDVKSEIS